MKKTTRELAIVAARKNIPDNYTSPIANAVRDGLVEAYTNGASTILEEIENYVFSEIQMKNIIDGHLILVILNEKFKEFKGK